MGARTRARKGALGLAAGLVLALPGVACAHPGYHHGDHRYERRYERHDRHDGRHHRRDDDRHHDRHRGRHHDRHALGKVGHGRVVVRGPARVIAVRAPWYCGRCRTGFQRRDRFAAHLHSHHRIGFTHWWGHVVRTPWGWAYFG